MWTLFENGTTIGQCGSENGIILRDEEHSLGARITLEKDGGNAPFSITCGIYGWMMHTRFFGMQPESENEYEQMKDAIAAIVASIPHVSDPDVENKMCQVAEAVEKFVERFP